MRATSLGAMPRDGSSSRSRRGRLIKARAIPQHGKERGDFVEASCAGPRVPIRKGAEQEVVEHREPAEQVAPLGDVRDPRANDLVRGAPVDSLPLEVDAPG